jgi:hypothetical protein
LELDHLKFEETKLERKEKNELEHCKLELEKMKLEKSGKLEIMKLEKSGKLEIMKLEKSGKLEIMKSRVQLLSIGVSAFVAIMFALVLHEFQVDFRNSVFVIQSREVIKLTTITVLINQVSQAINTLITWFHLLKGLMLQYFAILRNTIFK